MYCFTSLAGKTIRQSDRVKVTVHPIGGNIISVEKKTDVPVGVSQYSVSKEVDCQFLYIEFEPTDSNLIVREYLYCVKTIQFNPQYHLPNHDHYSAPEIYREYTSSGDRPCIDHTHHFYNSHRTNYLDIKTEDMYTTYIRCNITSCSCNQSLAQSQIQHPQPPTNNPASTISHPPTNFPIPNNIPSPKNLQKQSNRPRSSNLQCPKRTPRKSPGPSKPKPPLQKLPVPPKVQTNVQIPKNLPFPKNLQCPKRSPRKPPKKKI